MSSSEKPPADADEITKRTDNNNLLQHATKSTPHIKSDIKTDKKLPSRSSKISQSDGNIIKKPEEFINVKETNVKGLSPNNSCEKLAEPAEQIPEKDASSIEAGLIAEIDNLNFNIEDSWEHSELVHVRDSLEDLKSPPQQNSRSRRAETNAKLTNPQTQEKLALSDSHLYSNCSLLDNNDKPSGSAVHRVLTWDPWDKMGRNKLKTENKRRKMSEKTLPAPRVDKRAELQKLQPLQQPPPENNKEVTENYKYQPYHRPSKTVDFTSDVMVVYFSGTDVVKKGREPLKRELDQQLRNKEMRKGHILAMLGTKRKFPEDYKGIFF